MKKVLCTTRVKAFPHQAKAKFSLMFAAYFFDLFRLFFDLFRFGSV